MSARKPMSQKLRFEVFKRDGFKCQYCGAHPPAALLEVDHIHPVALGGDNDPDNLITACLPCNRGKSAVPLTVVPQSLEDKAAEVAEREAQIKGYTEIMNAARERLEQDVWRAIEYWQGEVESVRHETFTTIKRFVERLGVHEVMDAIDIMHNARIRGARHQLKYIAGVCWNKIRRLEQ